MRFSGASPTTCSLYDTSLDSKNGSRPKNPSHTFSTFVWCVGNGTTRPGSPFRAAVQQSTFGLDEKSLRELTAISQHPRFAWLPHTIRLTVDTCFLDPSYFDDTFAIEKECIAQLDWSEARELQWARLLFWYFNQWQFQNSPLRRAMLTNIFCNFKRPVRVQVAKRKPGTWYKHLEDQPEWREILDALEIGWDYKAGPGKTPFGKMWTRNLDKGIAAVLEAIAMSAVPVEQPALINGNYQHSGVSKVSSEVLFLPNVVEFTVSESLQHMDDMPLAQSYNPFTRKDKWIGSAMGNVETFQFQFIEGAVTNDLDYLDPEDDARADAFCRNLSCASHLKTLDLFVCNSNWDEFASPIYTRLSRFTPTYQLEELVLTMPCMDQYDFFRLLLKHEKTLKKVILIGPWMLDGSWNGLFEELAASNIRLDYFELYKPSEVDDKYCGDQFPIHTRLLGNAARSSYVVPFVADLIPETGRIVPTGRQEKWDHISEFGRPFLRSMRFQGC